MPRRKIIGVMGSGKEDHTPLAAPLGRWIAQQGFDLLTGAGQGVMATVSKAFYDVLQRSGVVLGIVPAGRPKSLYPNPWVEIAITTHLAGDGGPTAPDSRNHINVLSSDAVIALPGESGTSAEIELAMKYSKEIIIYWPDSPTTGKLPKGVPVAKSLDEVQDFVLQATGKLTKKP